MPGGELTNGGLLVVQLECKSFFIFPSLQASQDGEDKTQTIDTLRLELTVSCCCIVCSTAMWLVWLASD